MKPEAQRIAIAEACGWTEVHEWQNGFNPVRLLGTSKAKDGEMAIDFVPDYLNDLNAMHEAVKVLSDEQACLFRHVLSMNSDGPRATHLTVERAMCHATAAERAKAFLQVIGGWEKD